MSDLKEKRTNMFHVPLHMLEIEEGFNVREDFGDMEGLCQSIIENGVKVPLRGYKKKGEDSYIITDGHRRLKAARMAANRGVEGLRIPMVKEGKVVSDDSKVFNMLITNDGKPLNMVEKSKAFQRLVDYGYSVTDIAEKIGKSITHIHDCLLLSTINKNVQKHIVSGKVSATAVIEELRKNDPKKVEAKIKKTLAKSTKKVTPKDLGATPKKFSFTKLTKVCENLESDLEDESTLLDREKVKILSSVIQYLKGDLPLDKLQKQFWEDA